MVWYLVLQKSIYNYPLLGGHELRFSLDEHSTRIIMELEKFRDEMDNTDDNAEIISPGVKWMESSFERVSMFVAFHHALGPLLSTWINFSPSMNR